MNYMRRLLILGCASSTTLALEECKAAMTMLMTASRDEAEAEASSRLMQHTDARDDMRAVMKG
jgi:hypothetical protein